MALDQIAKDRQRYADGHARVAEASPGKPRHQSDRRPVEGQQAHALGPYDVKPGKKGHEKQAQREHPAPAEDLGELAHATSVGDNLGFVNSSERLNAKNLRQQSEMTVGGQ
jgi:hypothetical protein